MKKIIKTNQKTIQITKLRTNNIENNTNISGKL